VAVAQRDLSVVKGWQCKWLLICHHIYSIKLNRKVIDRNVSSDNVA
jgi:hypothetical protein